MSPLVARAWAAWTAEDGAPDAAIIPSRLRRRTSRLTRVAADVVARVADHSAVDLSTVATVFATAHGEAEVTVQLLEMLADEGEASPIRFTSSVHNAPAGILSIATGNRGFSTTVSAGRHTVAMALLEAATLVDTQEPEVLLVIAEEPLPPPVGPSDAYAALGAALWLARTGDGPRLHPPALVRRPPGPRTVPASVAGNPCAPALALIAALQDEPAALQDEPGVLRLELGAAAPAWCAEVERG